MPNVRALTLAALLALPVTAPASTLLQLPVEDLHGNASTLGDATAGKPAVLVVGFTRTSSEPASAWFRRLRGDPDLADRVQLFQVIVLEQVPRLLRGMVVRSIRKDIPESVHDHFLIVTERSDDWKQPLRYASEDTPYLAIIDPQRGLPWHHAGPPEDTAHAALVAAITELDKPDQPATAAQPSM